MGKKIYTRRIKTFGSAGDLGGFLLKLFYIEVGLLVPNEYFPGKVCFTGEGGISKGAGNQISDIPIVQ